MWLKSILKVSRRCFRFLIFVRFQCKFENRRRKVRIVILGRRYIINIKVLKHSSQSWFICYAGSVPCTWLKIPSVSFSILPLSSQLVNIHSKIIVLSLAHKVLIYVWWIKIKVRAIVVKNKGELWLFRWYSVARMNQPCREQIFNCSFLSSKRVLSHSTACCVLN